ncbi:cytochrome oxidase [Shewanella sp. Choline-02u-19]|jgi:cytochrome c oxidase cbb3-type subunit 2|uniref:cbb3-type cytochrome c oxidase subunit II n=1 Tax=unclassified Shewanella TaxID=196818 RepID=UPI000C322634|nr:MULTISPECIES: cbb3-type cytochrome c oxidase subunit II [unclassified Shewanella]PKG55400.1 cytochrome oxidase [Shewanella sp. GutDb-MelDb]PKG76109.1 cytochrome oxidase [Shewanella sp. GutCb]PKH56608.1 cytochrome oxidase [Shewanella sp. Bg11-22]PKI30159.1 cytochrome oxidase [Shewanella sp. Choline-02u-19]
MLSKDFTQSLLILIVSTTVVASFSILVLIVPSLVRTDEIRATSLAKPLTALEVSGRDVYISEGCHVCHTQMVRNIEPEVKRDGRPNEEGDDIYEFPNLWGSKRTGPDLTNLGRKYSAQWQRLHLIDPRQVVPTSLMPAYPWLFKQALSGDDIEAKMRVLQGLGVPYTENEIERSRLAVKGVTKGEALIHYLQSLGNDTASDQER